MDYEERFDLVLDHIHQHLADPLDLVVLADVAGLSPRHWHRVFASAFGETASALVRRLRMQHAAHLLANTDTPAADVAVACGYPNVASFTRTFRAAYGMPPARYRNEGGHTEFGRARASFDAAAFDVEIRSVPPVDCLSVGHRGSFLGIDQAFADLGMWFAAHGYPPQEQEFYGVFHSDPSAVPEAELRSRACFPRPAGLTGDVRPLGEGAAEVEPYTLPGGRYAVLTHSGPYADMPAKYAWFFGCWVVQTGWSLADGPVVERYLDLPHRTPPEALRTEMWLPLAGRT